MSVFLCLVLEDNQAFCDTTAYVLLEGQSGGAFLLLPSHVRSLN